MRYFVNGRLASVVIFFVLMAFLSMPVMAKDDNPAAEKDAKPAAAKEAKPAAAKEAMPAKEATPAKAKAAKPAAAKDGKSVVANDTKANAITFKGVYDGTSDAYKDQYEKHVGMSMGAGPLGPFYKPQKLHMYWSPDRHYVASNEKLDHTSFIKKDRNDLCVKCHEGINAGAVADWRNSAHFSPKKTAVLAAKTLQIEKTIGRKIDQVLCADCHVDRTKQEIRMPSATVCGQCHAQETLELMEERNHGRPNHIQGWESNVVVPWYVEADRRGVLTGMVGCDLCHASTEKCDVCHTRHTFSAAEARQPEACMSCHMGPDHPDAETYIDSKHGKIYEMEKEKIDFNKPLAQVKVGKDYRTPTCQLCHMYQGGGKYSHNFVSKGIWRMGTVPPTQIEYKSSLKAYPYGIKIIPPKVDIYSAENLKKRDKWIELCSKCHGPRFAEIYLTTLDDFMFQAFKLTDDAQLIMDELVKDDMLYPSAAKRDIFPVGDKIADLLGPTVLGQPVFDAFKSTGGKVPVIGPILGVYGLFYQGENNPSVIERAYAKMWFFYKLKGYKGVAHVQQDYMWWWGQAPMLEEYGVVQSENQRLRREAALEKSNAAMEKRVKDLETKTH
jgi:hydroxylamine dehydrogenase